MREARTPKPLAEAEAQPRLEALAESAWAQRDSDPALAQALAERVFAESAYTPYGQALSLIIQAILAFRDARHDVALKSAFEAQLTLGAEAAPVWHARLLNILGCIYLTLGERSLGLEYLHEQLTYTKAHNLSTEIFLAHHDLGVYFSNAGEPVRAQEFFDEASRWLPSDLGDQAFLEMNLAYHYAGQTMFQEAMKHTEIALALSRDIPKVYRLALETLAKVTLRQGDHTQTLQIYKELLAFDKANGFYLVHRGETLLQIGECQLALGETQRALDSLQQALEHGERSGNKLYIVNCHRLLSEAYKRSGEFEKALGHYELFHTHHEAMFSESSETRVRALEVRHRMDTLKQESELLKQKNTELARHNEALQELHERVHELSIRDPLTGLYNRRHLFEQTGELLKLTRRYSHPLSVAMLDIDHFKEINDTFGHKIGDAVLECIGELLRSTLRETDLTARYGGEEFALVMPNTALEDAVGVCERLRQHISDYPWSTLRTALKVNVSLGLAASSPLEDPLESGEAGDLFARADEQLYLAKRSGRNRIRF